MGGSTSPSRSSSIASFKEFAQGDTLVSPSNQKVSEGDTGSVLEFEEKQEYTKEFFRIKTQKAKIEEEEEKKQ